MALIYIVEDDDSIREIEEFALLNAGHQVVGCSCAKDFYGDLEKEKIRMIYQDFLISINEDEEEYLYSLKTRYAIDDACDQIIKERL